MERKHWRERWLNAISELTSLCLQQKAWLDQHKKNPHWSFAEFMCCYFDDILADQSYGHYIDIGWVLPEEAAILKNWHEDLDKYQSPGNDDFNNEAILNDKKWLEVVKKGVEAKQKLGALLGKEESRILLVEIDPLFYSE